MTDFGANPFLDHLVEYLAQLENPDLKSVSWEYSGPTSSKTTSIQRSLEAIARRLVSQDNLLKETHRPKELAQAPAAADGPSTPEPAVAEEWESVSSPEEELKQLRGQVKDVLRVCSAVRRGDFTQKVTVDVQDPLMVRLKGEVNAITHTLDTTMSQFITVSNKIGLKGELGVQAMVLDIEGRWREAVNVFNNMAGSLTSHLRRLMFITSLAIQGDLSQLPDIEASGEVGWWNELTTKLVLLMRSFTGEIRRVSQEFAKGTLCGKAQVSDIEGVWCDAIRDFNLMCSTVATHVRSVTAVSEAIERGDFTRQIDDLAEGEMLALKESMNSVSARISYFTQEITRTTHNYGDEGYYGGQIIARNFKGSWDTTSRSINRMYRNWTDQFRAHAEVLKSLAAGDFSQTVRVDANGEMGELKDTLNGMVERLSVLVSQTSLVAHEYGIEGKFGGQARVRHVGGQWAKMVDDINILLANTAVNYRSMHMAIAAMVHGDSSVKISGALCTGGEVLLLANSINELQEKLAEQSESV